MRPYEIVAQIVLATAIVNSALAAAAPALAQSDAQARSAPPAATGSQYEQNVAKLLGNSALAGTVALVSSQYLWSSGFWSTAVVGDVVSCGCTRDHEGFGFGDHHTNSKGKPRPVSRSLTDLIDDELELLVLFTQGNRESQLDGERVSI
ncbi:hypothetical protein BC826DRAFT_967368 [Russula brevipes]|nr:hypothetical protein BC826DRAFT_967368 [Russula brevipes]